jgi:hypothetical protein
MQFSLILQGLRFDFFDPTQLGYYVDITKTIERGYGIQQLAARDSEIQEKQDLYTNIARSGGRIRSEKLYGPAKIYTKHRYNEILSKKPTTSKRQAAKTIYDEALTQAAFKNMSQDNLFDTIYRWLLEKDKN